MSELYRRLHSNNIQQARDAGNEYEDNITWEPTCPDGILNKFETISNCQLKQDNTIHGINYWNIESAYRWFITENHKNDPNTTVPVKDGLFKRIRLQKRLGELVDEEERKLFVPDNMDSINTTLIANFNRYLQDKNSLTEKELVVMKSFLHIGDTKGFLTDYTNENDKKIDKGDIRDLALLQINQADNGSWLLRECSFQSSDFIKAYCITLKPLQSNIIQHIAIAHVVGFGYIVLDQAERGAIMPNKDSKGQFPKYNDTICASFIDLLEYISKECSFIMSKVLRNNK
jgi:hypothetical protein